MGRVYFFDSQGICNSFIAIKMASFACISNWCCYRRTVCAKKIWHWPWPLYFTTYLRHCVQPVLARL